MKKYINIQVFSLNQLIFTGKLKSVNLRTNRFAYITLFPDHSPLITDLFQSKIQIKLNKGTKKKIKIEHGIFYFFDNQAYVITNKAQIIDL